jgi:hypothetical protein
MALLCTSSNVWGFVEIQACVRVEAIASLSRDSMTAMVCWHADRNREPYDRKMIAMPYDLSGDNPIRQAYLHLKSLPEFAGATDC